MGHISDAVRLALLWKFGGTYYDSDIIALRELSKPFNMVMLENDASIGNAFLRVVKHHPIVWQTMKNFVQYYNVRVYIREQI